jgi:hypothetical protein
VSNPNLGPVHFLLTKTKIKMQTIDKLLDVMSKLLDIFASHKSNIEIEGHKIENLLSQISDVKSEVIEEPAASNYSNMYISHANRLECGKLLKKWRERAGLTELELWNKIPSWEEYPSSLQKGFSVVRSKADRKTNLSRTLETSRHAGWPPARYLEGMLKCVEAKKSEVKKLISLLPEHITEDLKNLKIDLLNIRKGVEGASLMPYLMTDVEPNSKEAARKCGILLWRWRNRFKNYTARQVWDSLSGWEEYTSSNGQNVKSYKARLSNLTMSIECQSVWPPAPYVYQVIDALELTNPEIKELLRHLPEHIIRDMIMLGLDPLSKHYDTFGEYSKDAKEMILDKLDSSNDQIPTLEQSKKLNNAIDEMVENYQVGNA